MKHVVLATVIAAIAVSSLAGCTGGGTTSARPSALPSTLPRASTDAAPVSSRTYSQADLEHILNSVNSTLALNGALVTLSAGVHEATTALDGYLANDANPSFTPAACEALLRSDGQLLPQLASAHVIQATLSSSTVNATLITIDSAPLPGSLTSTFSSAQAAQFATCKHVDVALTVDGRSESVQATFTTVPVTTTAGQSFGTTEAFKISGGGGGSTSTDTTLMAVYGNVIIFVSGVDTQSIPTLEKAVNAIVATAG